MAGSRPSSLGLAGCGLLVALLALLLGAGLVGGLGWALLWASLNPAAHWDTVRAHAGRALLAGVSTGAILLWLSWGIRDFRGTWTGRVLQGLSLIHI